jgi:glycosyltransferase involved in cell wall biosynthesis
LVGVFDIIYYMNMFHGITRVSSLVTVAIPAVRLDEHLDVAVASALAQTLPDVEVVVALDGTTLGSAPPHWAVHPRVRVLDGTHRTGTAATLNRAIADSTTPFVARLDADDIAEPHRLERQLAVLDADPRLDGVGSAATVIDERGRPIGHIDVPTENTAQHLLRHNPFVHSAMVLRRSALDRVGGYDPRCVRMQDYDLWLRLCTTGSLVNTAEPLVRYRVHDGMHSRRTSPLSESARRVLASRRRLARSLHEPVVRQSTRDAIWVASQVARNTGLRRPRYLTTT